MVTCHPINRIKERNEVESDDCEVTMQLLPMRCLLDQRAINFIRAFFHSDQKEGNDSEKWNAGLHYLPPPRFLAFRVKPWKVKVDYLPQVKIVYFLCASSCLFSTVFFLFSIET
jgi:hypothetical protein